jgi:hypothetical protein
LVFEQEVKIAALGTVKIVFAHTNSAFFQNSERLIAYRTSVHRNHLVSILL